MKTTATIILLVLAMSSSLLAAGRGVVDTTSSPHAIMHPAGLDEVKWTDGFWADRFELCRTQMVPGMSRLMQGTNYSQFYYNFEILAGLVEGKAHGASFNDGDFRTKFLLKALAARRWR